MPKITNFNIHVFYQTFIETIITTVFPQYFSYASKFNQSCISFLSKYYKIVYEEYG